MYGMKVHEAVVQNKDTETGITIHYVNEKYDEGSVIFQKSCAVTEADSAEEVAHKVHAFVITSYSIHYTKLYDLNLPN